MSERNPAEPSLRDTDAIEAAIIARRYYLDDKQKSEIAQELGISRFRVARLLDEARARGIVQITVRMPTVVDVEAGEAVSQAFGIGRVLAVPVPAAEPAAGRALISAACAGYLSEAVGAQDVLGVSWGSSVTGVVDELDSLAPAEIVQLVGGVHGAGLDIGGVELVRRMARVSGGRAFPLHAPLVVGSAEVAAQLRRDPSLTPALERFDRLSFALVGIGSWRPPRSALLAELDEDDRAELLAAGAVADICALSLASDGSLVEGPLSERTIGIGEAELRRIPNVVAVAYGADKVAAIRAALRSGLIETLVTDAATARALVAPAS